jgi:uncharacterized cysteine cluster protein YcgN (CxxCxxCC family)
MSEAAFWRCKPMAQMTPQEWESLCDGCGRCCTNTLEDEETGELFATRVACRLFCNKTGQCSDYANRQKKIEECIRITPENVAEMDFLPATCGYRLVWQGQDLPDWHHLKCGDREEIHRRGFSVRGQTENEAKLSLEQLEDYLFDWPEDRRFTHLKGRRWGQAE